MTVLQFSISHMIISLQTRPNKIYFCFNLCQLPFDTKSCLNHTNKNLSSFILSTVVFWRTLFLITNVSPLTRSQIIHMVML